MWTWLRYCAVYIIPCMRCITYILIFRVWLWCEAFSLLDPDRKGTHTYRIKLLNKVSLIRATLYTRTRLLFYSFNKSIFGSGLEDSSLVFCAKFNVTFMCCSFFNSFPNSKIAKGIESLYPLYVDRKWEKYAAINLNTWSHCHYKIFT